MKPITLLYWGIALVLGITVGLLDLHAKEVQGPAFIILLSGGFLGYLRPRWAWLWALTLGLCLLLVHIVADGLGYKTYPVEPNVFASLVALIPAFIGAYLGVLLRYIISRPQNA